jgi:TolB-like protein
MVAALAWINQKGKAHSPVGSVAVLPFRTVSDSGDDYRADGITDALITKLSNLKGLRVVSYSRVRQFKGASVEAADIGRKLGVEAVIEGTVRIASGQIRLSVHGVDTKTADTLWAEDSFDTTPPGLLNIESQLVERVALRLRGPLTGTERGLIMKSGTRNAEAYDLVLRAGAALRNAGTAADADTSGNRESAVLLLERAVQIDPTFADAYGWLAFAQHLAYGAGQGPETLRAAISNANQALSIDPNSLIAIRALAYIQHWTGREVEGLLMAKRALDINPDDLDATAAAAEAYFRTGLSDRAVPLYEKALRWEPESREFRTQLARIYFFRGEYGKGIDVISGWPLSRLGSFGMTFGLLLYVETGQLDKAVQAIREERLRDPSPPLNGFAAYVRGAVLEAAGDLTGARQIWTDAVWQSEALLAKQESPNPVYAYGLILNYAKLGNREKAMHFVHQSLAPDPCHPVRLFMAAEAHALLGNRYESLDSLKAAVKNGFFNLPLVEGMARSRICTLYSLRNDPEYLAIRADLARRVGQLRTRY